MPNKEVKQWGGGGGGAVSSVNSKFGAVVLNPDDLDDTLSTHKFVTSSEISIWNALQNASFFAGTMTVNTGTLSAGTVADLQEVGGTDVNIVEASGADPLRVTFDFTGVTRMTAFVFYGYYAGGSGHQIAIEIYNINTTTWDQIGIIGADTVKAWYSFPIFNPLSYVSSGNVSVRMRHVQSGYITHHLYLDYLEINYGGAGGQSDVSAASVSFTPTGNLSSTNVAAALAELDSEKAPALGPDDNYVTDAEKIVIGNTSGTNSGDNAPNSLYAGLSTSKENTGVAASLIATHAALQNVHGLNITAGKTLTVTNDASVSGTNTGDQVIPVKCTGAEINTGTDDAKFATPKSIADSALLKSSGGTLTGEVDLGENAGLVIDAALSADGKYSGITESGTAGEALVFGNLAYLDATASKWKKVDANVSTGYDKKLGMVVLAAGADGNPTKLLLWGKIRADSAFPSLSVGAPVYMSETAGEIVTTQPTTAHVCIRIIGFGNTADELFFNPSQDYRTHT